ncbi:MAG: hypothetical protein QOD72_2583 [Acidimicrobiaceae bacterium]|nr:hypothetical protein [Acidimicrobiaceae bacterium]
MDVAVDGAGGKDAAVAGDHFGGRSDHQIGVDTIHRVRVAGLAEGHDASVAHADVGFDHAPMVEHDGAGDDRVEGALGASHRRLPHRLTDHLAAAEHSFVAAGATVFGDLHEQIGVGQA